MALKSLMMTMALSAAIAVPAAAQDGQRHRATNDQQQNAPRDRAVPRGEGRRGEQPQQAQAQPQRQAAAQPQAQPQRQEQAQRQQPQAQQRAQAQRQNDVAVPRRNDAASARSYSNNDRGYQNRSSDNRAYNNNAYNNRSYNNNRYDGRRWDNGRYESYVSGRHRYNAYVIHPEVVRVIPYRPYAYRPSFSLGVYYGSNGYYPYGYTPDYYFNPIPGRAYGGVRITGAPRDAQVFADGYYVGIVDDFDGIFQHVNLEAGPHHIEVAWGGYQPMAFDIYVRPGETTTFRADGYFRY